MCREFRDSQRTPYLPLEEQNGTSHNLQGWSTNLVRQDGAMKRARDAKSKETQVSLQILPLVSQDGTG